jgi:D-alanyl-lipoteichoic acid acyltransferase DltB (MBOAT superfamily)
MRIRNTFIIFLVSGFWHGANWTFIVWGLLNALFIMPSIIMKTNRNNLETVAQGQLLPSVRELFQMIITFTMTVFAWIFFRAESVTHAFDYILGIFKNPHTFLIFNTYWEYRIIIILIVIFMIVEWIGREDQFAIQKIGMSWSRPMRYVIYYVIILAIFWFGGKEQQFIYFQF